MLQRYTKAFLGLTVAVILGSGNLAGQEKKWIDTGEFELFTAAAKETDPNKVSEEALMAIGLTTRDAESLVLFEGTYFCLALENPENLRWALDFGKRDCVRAIALARLIIMFDGETGDLVEFLKGV